MVGLNVGGGSNQTLGCRSVTTNVDPYGSFHTATTAHGVVTVSGWAADPNTPQSLVVDVYADNAFVVRLAATGSRPDVAAVYPAAGPDRGFAGSGGSLGQGTHSICVYAINAGPGQNVSLGCRSVTVSVDPFGSFDVATQYLPSDQITVGGWALDPDTTDPINVDVYADGVGVQRHRPAPRAPTSPRPTGSAPTTGSPRPSAPDPGQPLGVRVRHQRRTRLRNPSLGCRTVTVSLDPFGVIDRTTRTSATTAVVTGWAMDPNSPSPINVVAGIGGTTVATATANGVRNDVAAAYGNGAAHGYSITVPVGAAEQTVCITAANVGPGTAAQIACDDVPMVGAAPPSPPAKVTATGGYARSWWRGSPRRTPVARRSARTRSRRSRATSS